MINVPLCTIEYSNQQFQFCSKKRQMYSNYSFSMPKPYQSIQMPKSFPEDIECIIKAASPHAGSLYISNVQAASNPDTLKRLRITAVLSCAKGYELKHPRSVVPHYKYIPTVDHDECDISVHFEQAVAFINDKLKEANVLVHCIAGVSRSVSMVLAYFIKHHDMHYQEAYRLVKSKRKIIHPNDGFIRQLKKFSQALKAQQKNNRKEASNVSPNKATDVSLSFEKSRENFLDKSTGNFKSIELSPHKDITPNKNSNPRTNIYERYSSAQLKTTSPVQERPSPVRQTPSPAHQRPPIAEEPFQSLQYIPDSDPYEYGRAATLTPKTKQDLTHEKYDLVRTSTNYFTPSKPTLLNQRPYQATRYEDLNKNASKLQRPLTSPHINPPVSPSPAGNDSTSTGRREYFASKNSELNEKIEMIRKKYAAQREKLIAKYQSPQKEPTTPTNNNDPERRRVSLGDYRATNTHNTTRPLDYQHRTQTRQAFARTDSKHEVYGKLNSFQSYGELYQKKAERVSSFVLNEEETFPKGEKSLRNNLYDAAQRNSRQYDRLGSFGGTQYGYSAYSPYYKYGASSYKRYY